MTRVPHVTVEQQQLIDRVRTFASRNTERREVANRVIELICSSPRAAYRDNFSPGHLTGSAWVVDPVASQVLLLHHAKLGRWLQPGGHADGEYDIAAVALREAQEESGLTTLRLIEAEIFDIDIHRIPERAHEPEHYHFDIRFVVAADSQEQPVISHESHGAKWVKIDEIGTLTSDESVLRMARMFVELSGSM
jgi:8-oxo-dGTP pyrophosphatase MutT (NUDIX family)